MIRSVGARVDDEGKGGPLWSPAGWSVVVFPQDISEMNRYAGDPKGLCWRMKVEVEVVRYRKAKASSRQKEQEHDDVSPSHWSDPSRNRPHCASRQAQRNASDVAA